jgi:prepilin-type N-terminal cleavage/methylation domain-containing protein/prepilin-type processing-associated H-X9-DG protein
MRSRPGYTLIELLVVIGIVAVLLGLLLPAAQQVRAAAARAKCANNLRQLVLAAHLYHDREGAFPPGVEGHDPGRRYPGSAWLTRLLPDLEQGPLWDRAVTDYAANPIPARNTPPHFARDRVMPVFSCPADDRMGTAWEVTLIGITTRVALTSYLGNLGTSYRQPDGVLFLDSRVRLTDVRDGTSATLFAGERPPSPDLVYGWWYAGIGQAYTGSLDMVIGARERNGARPWYAGCGPGPFQYQPGSEEDFCSVFHYWSPHANGANFAFADGSVRFLAYSADPIMPALATRAGGEVVAVPD